MLVGAVYSVSKVRVDVDERSSSGTIRERMMIVNLTRSSSSTARLWLQSN